MSEVQTPEIPIQNQEPQPVLPKKKFDLKIIAILLVAILLLVAGLVYAGMQLEKRKVKVWVEPPLIEITSEPTGISDETANWETYSNTEYGFKFKYPASFFLKNFAEDSNNNVVMISDVKIEDPYISPESCFKVLIAFENNPKRFTFEDFVKEKNSEPDRGQGYYLSSEVKRNIEGREVYYMKDAYCVINCSHAVIPHKDKFWVFTYSSGQESKQHQLPLFDQILSSFKFIDEKNMFSCTIDNDCGLNICDCRAERKEFISPEEKLCMRVCPGELRCVSGVCKLI